MMMPGWVLGRRLITLDGWAAICTPVLAFRRCEGASRQRLRLLRRDPSHLRTMPHSAELQVSHPASRAQLSPNSPLE